MNLRFLIFLLFFVINHPKAFAKFHVIIDPGHGGQDSGASAIFNPDSQNQKNPAQKKIKESQLVYEVAQRLKDQLEKNPGWSASLSRSDKNYVPLKQRILKAHEEHGDLFVSIHANASIDPKARGAEFYFQAPHLTDYEGEFYKRIPEIETGSFSLTKEGPKKDEVRGILASLKRQSKIHKSKDLAFSISNQFSKQESTRANAIQQAPFYVVTKTEMPSVLVELGFVSNITEAKQLQSPEYQELLAGQISRGIYNFKEILDKDHRNDLK
jgi:N-acetylmuramoyl-L-alanine amidase